MEINLRCLSFLLTSFFFESISVNGANVEEKPTWSVRFNESGYYVSIVESRGSFFRTTYYEHWPTGCYFYITPVDKDAPCDILSRNVSTRDCERWSSAKSLGNGKIVLDDNYNIAIVNPETCASVVVEKEKRGGEMITYENNFDIVREEEYDNPKISRYDESGVLYETLHSADIPFGVSSRKFFTFKQNNPAVTCFVYSHLGREISFIDALNATYQSIHKYKFNHTINVFSTAHNAFGLCYRMRYSNVIKCRILDLDFNVKLNETSFDNSNDVNGIAIYNLVDGGAIVVYSIPRFVSSAHVYYRRIHSDGHIDDEPTFITENFGEDTKVTIHEKNATSYEYCVYLSYGNKVNAHCFTL